jgi:hypothetical protein
MVRKACAGEMRWRPGGRPGSESVHSTTLATLAEQNRCQVGPTILFDRPRQDPPTPRFNRSPVGPPLCGDQCRAEVRRVGGRSFSNFVPRFRPLDKDDALPMVRKACAGEMRWRPGGRPGSESVHSTTLATLAEQNRCQVGPTILFDRPGRIPPLLGSPVGPPLCGDQCRAEVRRVGGGAFQISPLDFGPSIKMTRYPW